MKLIICFSGSGLRVKYIQKLKKIIFTFVSTRKLFLMGREGVIDGWYDISILVFFFKIWRVGCKKKVTKLHQMILLKFLTPLTLPLLPSFHHPTYFLVWNFKIYVKHKKILNFLVLSCHSRSYETKKNFLWFFSFFRGFKILFKMEKIVHFGFFLR